MSLDYLPLAYRRIRHIERVRAERLYPVRPAEPGETPLSPAEVEHGIYEGILRRPIHELGDKQ